MRRTAVSIALATAALLGATASAALGSFIPSKLAVNPELVNPVVVSQSFLSGALTITPEVSGVAPTPPSLPDFWTITSGDIPVLTTPPAEDPEIVIADVQKRMSILYATDPSVAAILGSSDSMRRLPWLFRQEPANSAGGAALGDETTKRTGTQRISKVNGAALAAKPSADAMAAMLKAAVDRNCTTPAGVNTCGAHLATVDEIGSAFGTAPGESNAGSPGERLKNAMVILSKKQFQPGESYASRIHFYVAPGMSTSIAAGLGTNRTLGANGKEMRRDYSQAMSALSRAGGVWLEMFHYPERGKPRLPFTAAEWRDVPINFAGFLRQRTTGNRNPLNYLHFVLTDTPGAPKPVPEPCRAQPPTGQSPNSLNIDVISLALDALPACPATPPPACPVLRPVASPNALSIDRLRRPDLSPAPRGPYPQWISRAAEAMITPVVVRSPVQLAVMQPDDSGMTCQWQRAQAGDTNTTILSNGPAAYRVTEEEATIYGDQFRQFFLVG